MNIQQKKQQEYANMWQKTHGKDQWFVGHPPFKVLKCPLSNSRHGKSKLCPMAGKLEHEWIHDNFLLKKFPLPKGLWGVLCSDSCCSFRGINFFSPYHHETRFVNGQPKFWLCLKLWWHDDITGEAAMFGAMSRCGPWFWTHTTAHNDNAQPPNPWQPHLIVIKNHCFSPSKHHPKATGGLSATFHVKSNCLSINSISLSSLIWTTNLIELSVSCQCAAVSDWILKSNSNSTCPLTTTEPNDVPHKKSKSCCPHLRSWFENDILCKKTQIKHHNHHASCKHICKFWVLSTT